MRLALGPAGDLVRGRIFYGWYIALAGAFTSFFTFGVVGFGFGVFIEPIREETGWSLAAISVGFSLRSFEHGLLAPVTGALVDRLGARRMAITGVLIVGIGLLLFSQARVLWVYYIASLVVGSGESLGSSTAYSASLMRWFDRKRGQALGAARLGARRGLLHGPGAGGADRRARLAVDADRGRDRHRRRRAAALLRAAQPSRAVRLPAGRRLRAGHPDCLDRRLAGRRHDGRRGAAHADLLPARRGHGDRGATQISWIVHQVPHLQNVGFTLQGAALITGAYGLFQVPLRFICGWFGDIIGRRRLYVIAYLLQALGMLIFAWLSPDRMWLLPAYFLTFPFAHAAWVAMFMTLIADYFGTRYFATIRGLTSTMMMPLGFATPIIAGWSFDELGSYRLVFTCYALITLSGAVLLLLIRRPTWAQLASR